MGMQKAFCSLILLTLMFFKVSSLHVYTHHDNQAQTEDCSLCETAINNQNADFALPAVADFPSEITITMHKGQSETFDSLHVSNAKSWHYFSRPPPTA